jgi:DNA repair exonuclease SbcCD ATPase subunit
MFKDKDEQKQELLDEAMGLKGMIAEVQSKARLLKLRMQREQTDRFKTGDPMIPSESLQEDVRQSVEQMKDDLAKYSQRLKEINEELASYEITDFQ